MKTVQRLHLSCLFVALVALLSLEHSHGQQTPDSQPADKPIVPTQPGDDVAAELKQDVPPAQEKKSESLAAYMEGVAAQKNGDFQAARKAFDRAMEADPTAPEPVRAQALLYVRLNRLKEGERLARKAAELDPDDYEIRLQLADLLLARRETSEALVFVEEALGSKRLDRNSREFIGIHRVRGAIFLLTGNAPKAAESYIVLLNALERPEDFGLDFREHQRLMNDRATGYESIGRIMLEIGRYDEAVRAFTALERISGSSSKDVYYWLALTHYRKDDLPEAEKALDTYFESGRRSRESLRLLSDILNASSRSDDALSRLQELTQNTNDSTNVRLFLGDLYIDRGEKEKAAEVFQKIISDTGDADAWLGLIKVDILARDPKSLIVSLNKAIRARIRSEELVPLESLITSDVGFAGSVVDTAVATMKDKHEELSPVALHFFAELAEKTERFEQEEALLVATLQSNPDALLGIEVLNRLGLNQYTQDKFSDAADTFRRLLAVPTLPPGDRIMTLYRLSYAEAFSENFDDALAAIEEANRLAPSENGELVFQLGWVQLQAKKLEEAERSLQRAAALAESDGSLASRSRILLAGLYSQMKRWDESIAAYEAVLQIPDVDSDVVRRARSGLSNAYVQKGDLANGERILEEVYAASPDDPGINNDLGYLYADQNKNLDKAEKMIRIAVEAEPDNPAYLDSLGWVLHRLGRNKEAVEVLKKANSDPDYQDATIMEHLGDVQEALQNRDEALQSWKKAIEIENKATQPDSGVIDRITKKLTAAGSENRTTQTDTKSQDPVTPKVP